MTLENSLTRIEEGLRALGRTELMERLQPGVAAERTRAALSTLGLRSNPDLETYFAWHNGVGQEEAVLDDIHLFPGFYPASLEEVVANHQAFVKSPRWNPSWLPLFANGGGDFYAVDNSDEAGSVVHFRIDESEHPVEFESLPALMATLAEAFEQGVYYVDDDGYLEMDDDEFELLAQRLNPQVAWWNE